MVTIREPRDGDHDQWLELWAGYNEFYGRKGETALAPAVNATTWARIRNPAVRLDAFLAERDGRLVGLTHYLFHLSTVELGEICYLRDLFVTEECRSLGVGRLLIDAVVERARAGGAPKVYWQTHPSNAKAKRLYDVVATISPFQIYERNLSSGRDPGAPQAGKQRIGPGT